MSIMGTSMVHMEHKHIRAATTDTLQKEKEGQYVCTSLSQPEQVRIHMGTTTKKQCSTTLYMAVTQRW